MGDICWLIWFESTSGTIRVGVVFSLTNLAFDSSRLWLTHEQIDRFAKREYSETFWSHQSGQSPEDWHSDQCGCVVTGVWRIEHIFEPLSGYYHDDFVEIHSAGYPPLHPHKESDHNHCDTFWAHLEALGRVVETNSNLSTRFLDRENFHSSDRLQFAMLQHSVVWMMASNHVVVVAAGEVESPTVPFGTFPNCLQRKHQLLTNVADRSVDPIRFSNSITLVGWTNGDKRWPQPFSLSLTRFTNWQIIDFYNYSHKFPARKKPARQWWSVAAFNQFKGCDCFETIAKIHLRWRFDAKWHCFEGLFQTLERSVFALARLHFFSFSLKVHCKQLFSYSRP